MTLGAVSSGTRGTAPDAAIETPAARGDGATSSGDAALVAACLRGDDHAWAALVERYGPVVWAVAKRMDLSQEDAADVFQCTWKVALEELSRVRDPAAVGGWIARVARHQSMRVRRGYGIARKSWRHVAKEDLDPVLPDSDLERLEMRAKVTAALELIGERCAALLRALYFEDPQPSYQEIAVRTGMRIGSIGPTRARCLGKMLDEMGGDSDA